MDTYSNRLKEIMDKRCVTVTMLSRACGLSYQAIKKVIDGKTASLGTANNFAAAKYLSVSPAWLAGAEGGLDGSQDAQSTIVVQAAQSVRPLPSALALELAYTFDELGDRKSRNIAYAAATNAIMQAQASSVQPSVQQAQAERGQTLPL